MDVSLRKFRDSDRESLTKWVEAIDARQFMSRFSPKLPCFAWYVILLDGNEAGTVWLEKENPDDPEAVLGILIGQRDRLGKGIGRAAIRLAVEQAQPILHFRSVRLNVRKGNTRAIACYRNCGFSVSGEGEGRNQYDELLQFYEMRMEINPDEE